MVPPGVAQCTNHTAMCGSFREPTTGGRREWQSANTWTFFPNSGPAFCATEPLSAPFQWRRLRALSVPLSSCCSKCDTDCRACDHDARKNLQHKYGLILLLFAQKNGFQFPTQEVPESRIVREPPSCTYPAEAEPPTPTAKEVPRHPGT